MSYVNLHLHTDASHLDGLNDLTRLMKRLKEIGATACAITDHGNMHGVLKFYRACIENDIKPILGFEAYVSHNHKLQAKSEIEAEVERTGDDFVRFQNHLVLLAKNYKGYQNLLKLTTLGFTNGFYKKPTIDFELLKQYSEGVICINGHVGTDIARAYERYVNFMRAGDYEAGSKEFERAWELNTKYKEVFGEDYYLEIQNHGLNIEKDISPLMIELAGASGVSLVMTNDSHYTWRTDAEPHRIHMSNGIGRTLEEFMNSDFEGFKDSDEFYVKSYEEMLEMATPFGEPAVTALSNTLLVADKCDVKIDAMKFGGMYEENGKMKGKWSQKDYLFPNFPIAAPYANMGEYFLATARKGLQERFDNDELYGLEEYSFADYQERLEYEIKVILDMGFPTYFLILWDVLRFCRQEDIPVGKGRGSGAGSLALYSLRITDIDPLPYQLIFERFLNPSRISLPDVDTDFCYDRIEEVIAYVRATYGNEYVCKIGTFGTLGAKAVLKDVSRVLRYPFDKINGLTRQVTDISISIDKIMEKYPDFKTTYDTEPEFKRVVDVAKRLEGLQRHTSQHAAGLVISPFPLTDLIPLKGDSIYDLTSQWEMGDIELLGFVKMDFLRLRTLTVVKNTLRAVERQTGEQININRISLDDQSVYDQFHQGNSLGIFQFESDGMQRLLKRNKPNSIEDLTTLNALYRPGPLDAKVEDESSPHFGKTMVDIYSERAAGLIPVEYDHPLLERVLINTYGVITYQEQVMQASVALARFTLPDADELRKVVGKKIKEKMPIQKEKFKVGCLSNPEFINGCSDKSPQETFEHIWKQIETFARYGFPKAHSCAYADLAYRAMWLKVHYPLQFMSAVLTSWMGAKIEDLVPYLNECRRMGIKILPPDVNRSSAVFEASAEGTGIHFGLTGIKGVGAKAVQNIFEVKATHAINSLIDFMSLTGSSVNKTVVNSLIKCGAFDFLGLNRRTLLKMAEEVLEINQKIKQKITANAKRKNPVSDVGSFYDTIHNYEIEIVDEFPSSELSQMERELTGFYMAHHPLDGFIEYIRSKSTNTSIEINMGIPIENLSEDDHDDIEEIYIPLPKGRTIITGGVIKTLKLITVQNGRSKGKQMASFVVEDGYQGDVKCLVFADVFAKFRNTIREGNIVLINGTLDYYRESPQINVMDAREIDREVARRYLSNNHQNELSKIEESIQAAEEMIDIVGFEDLDLISTICEELILLYDRKNELEKLVDKEAV